MSWSLLVSIAAHVLIMIGLLSLYISERALDDPGPREHRIDVARAEVFDEPPVEPEPETDLTPPDEPLPPELIPREYVQPAPEDPPPELDDSFELEDPFRRLTIVAWPAPPPVLETPPPPVEVSPPAPRPREEPRSVRVHVPVVLEDPKPVYPRRAMRLGLEGSVKLRAHVNKNGSVERVTLVASSGHELLDEAGREKLLEWLFRTWESGEPEQRTYLKTFTFRLPR